MSYWSVNKILPLAQLIQPSYLHQITSQWSLQSAKRSWVITSWSHSNPLWNFYCSYVSHAIRMAEIRCRCCVWYWRSQRSAAKNPAEVFQHTQISHWMQGVFGRPTSMIGILMGFHSEIRKKHPLSSHHMVRNRNFQKKRFSSHQKMPVSHHTKHFKPHKCCSHHIKSFSHRKIWIHIMNISFHTK